MNDFMMAAFPLVIIGIALAVTAVMYAKASKMGITGKFGKGILAGAGIGLILSGILKSLELCENIPLCYLVFPMCGIAIAALIRVC